MDWVKVKRGLLDCAHIDHGVVDIAQQLKHQAQIALLSNAPRDVVEGILMEHGVVLPLIAKVISGDVGLMKPDPAIYRAVLNLTDKPPTAAIMIDDRGENVVAAEALGMTGIEFTSASQLAARLSAVGFALRC
jgi:HAD superfamily hydrolase (TIGR01509 family)